MKNDIALLRLAERVKFTEFIRPACLSTDLADVPSGTSLTITGKIWHMIRFLSQFLHFPTFELIKQYFLQDGDPLLLNVSYLFNMFSLFNFYFPNVVKQRI